MFALAMYTYSTAVLFVPLWIMALIFLKRKIPSLPSILLFTLILTPLIYSIVLVSPAAASIILV